MSMRGPSGKFSLANFGRKASGTHDGVQNGYESEMPESPTREGGSGFMSGGGGGGNGSSPLDGLGKKLGKSLAHQSLLPGLGNKEQRSLQELITAEKGVIQSTERFSQETQKAGSALQAYGAQEGADLADILTHSSTLLDQLGTALAVFVDHSANLRGCYKRIREREEELDELRRRRRSTGAKSESAEKRLAKMGPENKQLPTQTELLERLRAEMRQMDTDIINEESRLGDYKRQQVKDALSSKFGGLEELGEKMCIIGELGKLLLEEMPLEETPPGYGRAPYQGYAKTESAVNEATKCLATVKFSAGSASPRPMGMPSQNGTPHLPNPYQVAAAEEYGTLPLGADGSTPRGKGRDYSLDTADPYGGLSNPYDQRQPSQYDEYGGTRGGADSRQVMFQGPNEEALGSHSAQPDYEYEQQKQLDAEEKAWREGQPTTAAMANLGPVIPPVHHDEPTTTNEDQVDESGLSVPWQPLNVKRDRPTTPSVALHDGGAPQLDTPDLGEHIAASSQPARGVTDDHTNGVSAQPDEYSNSPTTIDLPPPPPIGGMAYGGPSTPSEREGFYTPMQGPTPEPYFPTTMPAQPSPPLPPPTTAAPPPPPAPIPIPSPALPLAAQTYNSAPGSGKISAAAFRRGAKNRGSVDPEDASVAGYNAPSTLQSPGSINTAPRRLPLPPPGTAGVYNGGPETPIEAGFELPASPERGEKQRSGQDTYDEARSEEHPPPSYGHSDSLR